MSIRVLDPTYAAGGPETVAPVPLRSLVGRTVALLDNSKLNVGELLDYVEELLRTRYGVRHVVRLKKLDASRPAPPEVFARMTGCDAAISAVGD